MNYGMIVYMLGWICLFEAMFMALPLMVAVIYQEPAGWAYLMVLVLCAVLAGYRSLLLDCTQYFRGGAFRDFRRYPVLYRRAF